MNENTHPEHTASIQGYLRRIGGTATLGQIYSAHPSSDSTLPFLVAAKWLVAAGLVTASDERIEPSTTLTLADAVDDRQVLADHARWTSEATIAIRRTPEFQLLEARPNHPLRLQLMGIIVDTLRVPMVDVEWALEYAAG